MSLLTDLVRRFRGLFRDGSEDAETREELRFHLEMETEKNERAGMDSGEARRRARLRLGGLEAIREAVRDARGARPLEDLARGLRNVKQAWRLLARNRGFAVATLATIALGVGGTAAVFSVVYGVLLRPLPYVEPEQLVRLWEVHPGANAPIPGAPLSRQTYHAWAESATTLQGIGSYRVRESSVTGAGVARRARGTRVTPSLLDLLRAAPAIGRLFVEGDAEQGAEPVVVLAHQTWRTWFAGDAGALGRRVAIDDVDHRVVGVMRDGFDFPPDGRNEVAFYTPFAVPLVDPEADVISMVAAIARLAPGTTAAQAEAEGTAYARAVDRPFSELVFGEGGPVEVRVRSLVDQMTMSVRPALVMLTVGVGLVLLVACANVANLLLARQSGRSRELAIRAALGAGRGRLARQLLTESLVISLLGGALGLGAGWVMTVAVPALAPAGFPRVGDIRVDVGFLVAALVAAVFVGAAAGTLPALRHSRVALAPSMQAGGARAAGSSGGGLRRGLLVVESALAVVLLVGAALFARSLVALLDVDAGYDPANVLVADVSISEQDGQTNRTEQLLVAVLERVRGAPGVRAAGAGSMAPFGDFIYSWGFNLPGVATAGGEPLVARALASIVTPGYVEALSIPLTDGRVFTTADTTSPVIAMLVNEMFVRAYLNDGRPPVGRRFIGMLPNLLGRDDAVVHVVGVVDDVLLGSLDGQPQPQIYLPLGAAGVELRRAATLVVKTDGDPESLVPLVTRTVRTIEPAAAVSRTGALTARVTGTSFHKLASDNGDGLVFPLDSSLAPSCRDAAGFLTRRVLARALLESAVARAANAPMNTRGLNERRPHDARSVQYAPNRSVAHGTRRDDTVGVTRLGRRPREIRRVPASAGTSAPVLVLHGVRQHQRRDRRRRSRRAHGPRDRGAQGERHREAGRRTRRGDGGDQRDRRAAGVGVRQPVAVRHCPRDLRESHLLALRRQHQSVDPHCGGTWTRDAHRGRRQRDRPATGSGARDAV